MPLPTTRAYVSDADADDYFIHTFRHGEWVPLSIGEKTIALQEATRALEALCYKGEKCSDTQPLKWPRKVDGTDCCAAADCTTLPPQMVEATCELALALHNDKTALLTTGGTGSGAVKRNKLGDLEQEFFEPGAGDSKVSNNAPLVLQKFPWLVDMLSCYADLVVGSSRVLSRCC